MNVEPRGVSFELLEPSERDGRECFVDLAEGSEVIVHVNGEDRAFRVSEPPEHVTKGDALPEVVNQAEGDNRLVLITCGGEFVGGQLGYADNVISVADPV